MRVFVTGDTGLVGARLIRRLRERQDHVVVLTRRPAAARERLDSTDRQEPPAVCGLGQGTDVATTFQPRRSPGDGSCGYYTERGD
jgi:nucleoside-diphosphate-sugar epimerase